MIAESERKNGGVITTTIELHALLEACQLGLQEDAA